MAARLFAGVTYRLRDLAAALGCALSGDGEIEITGIAGMEQAGPTDLTFLANPKYTHKVKQTRAAAILITERLPEAAPACLVSANPYHDFARALALFYQPPRPNPGIHPQASIASSAVIGDGVAIGPDIQACAVELLPNHHRISASVDPNPGFGGIARIVRFNQLRRAPTGRRGYKAVCEDVEPRPIELLPEGHRIPISVRGEPYMPPSPALSVSISWAVPQVSVEAI